MVGLGGELRGDWGRRREEGGEKRGRDFGRRRGERENVGDYVVYGFLGRGEGRRVEGTG